jgi:hypothetical protein
MSSDETMLVNFMITVTLILKPIEIKVKFFDKYSKTEPIIVEGDQAESTRDPFLRPQMELMNIASTIRFSKNTRNVFGRLTIVNNSWKISTVTANLLPHSRNFFYHSGANNLQTDVWQIHLLS